MTHEETLAQFRSDMEQAGYQVTDYAGRCNDHSPAVRVESNDLQAVMRSTSLTLQGDTLGKRRVVIYPAG